MSLSQAMKWVLAVMREEGVTIQRHRFPGQQARVIGRYSFHPQPHATRGRPSRESVLALEHRGLIALERVGARSVHVLTEKGRA